MYSLLSQIINSILEETKYTNKTISFIDIDETMLNTTAKIAVKDKTTGEIKYRLTNQEFNTHKLNKTDEYGFSEFRDPDKFIKESKPIPVMIREINKILNVERLSRGLDTIVFITARSDFKQNSKMEAITDEEIERNSRKAKEKIMSFFKKTFGLPMKNKDFVHIKRAGNLQEKYGMSVPDAKNKIMSEYLDTGNFKIAKMFDDSTHNLDAFLKLADKYPNIHFNAILVDNGNLRQYKQKN